MKKRKTTRKAKPVRGARRAATRAARIAKTRRTHRAPAAEADTLRALVTANAQALGLTLDPAWLGGIKFNLGLILRLAALVDGFALPDETEPAPVFYA